ncbi:MAG TPA: hypothetical protein VN767_25830 [Streptosporangiaceae bacterium]|nr:hypothetical protein [Streptosporangiaceae bacterium]
MKQSSKSTRSSRYGVVLLGGIHPRLNWAVGYSQNGTKADINQILHWNGTKWLAN